MHLDEVQQIVLQLNQFFYSILNKLIQFKYEFSFTNRSICLYRVDETDRKSFRSVSLVSNNDVLGVFHLLIKFFIGVYLDFFDRSFGSIESADIIE